jgi:alcohol dehydrogenase (cytochrome c)
MGQGMVMGNRVAGGIFFRTIVTGLVALGAALSLQAQMPPPPKMQPGTPQAAGQHTFVTRCASCHGTNAMGGEFAPGIVDRVPLRTDDELVRLLHSGLPGAGMPAFPDIVDQERSNLISYLRTLKPFWGPTTERASATLQNGKTVQGIALNRSDADMQLLGDDHQLYLLRKAEGDRYREVTSQADWPSYNGQTTGGRYSALKQITNTNVSSLQAKWIFTLPNIRQVQATPVVVDGLMYVTVANECFALDAGSGRPVWHYRRSRTQGITGLAALGVNRGVAIAGDRVFMVTDNAHMIALNRLNGALLWETEIVDWHLGYNANTAPLVVGNMVVTGISGGDDGVRGFIAAYDQTSGKEMWRFWTTPKPGEPGSETWKGTGIDHPGGATWMTGTYDKELDTLYWPVGNPGNDMIGDQREGDNLYTDSVVALDPSTGKLKWYFQFTPHDLHDYDAMAPPSLIDTTWDGKPRKLMVQANRNGFLYVLDRTNGKFLFGHPITTKLTWATGLTAEGRPIVAPGHEPTPEGTKACPWLNGASNWYSTSWNPLTSLYYVQTNDKCGIFTRTDEPYKEGRGFMGGSNSADPSIPGRRVLRAFDIHTGKAVWELPQTGAADSWGGVLSTAGDVVVFGADDGSFAAADAKTGKLLWSFPTGQEPHNSPMTYMFDHKQFIVTAMGPNILAFGLPD